jgi:hypothetical protein
MAADFVTAVRCTLARCADALVLRYGLHGGPECSYREIGRRLGVTGHIVHALVQ